MDILGKLKGWANSLTEVAVSLLALGIVLGNVQAIIAGFSAQGLVGLVAVWVLYSIYTKK